MLSWDPDNVERIAPFTPSCHQKKESTWRIDDVDRISPFIPIRQKTWTIEDVDHIQSFVPVNNCPASHNSSPSSSSQYDTAMSSPLSVVSTSTTSLGVQDLRASSSQSSGSVLDTSTESVDSTNNSPDVCSKREECTPETEPVENKGFNLHSLLRLIDTSNCSVAGNSSEDETVCVEHTDLDDSSSNASSSDPSHNSATQCDVDTLVEVLRRQFSSNETSSAECDLNQHSVPTSKNHVEHLAPPSTASNQNSGSCSPYRKVEDVSDDDTPLFEDAEGSLEMSTEFVIQEPTEDKEFDVYFSPTVRDESTYMTGDYSDDDGPLPWEVESQSTKDDLYNPYAFSRPCIAATNSFGRGIDLSSDKTQVDLKDKRRLGMDSDYVPAVGRGAILRTYTNRHRTDESLNQQLRMTLGVGYSNEATENFWRGEQEENKPLDKPPERRTPSPTEVDDLFPLSPLRPEADIIYVSPSNKCSPTCKKAPERPRATVVPVKKSTSPHKASQDTSPNKKKTTARRNRNALLSSLGIEKEVERPTTPGMPPGALTYVHSDTRDKFIEQNEFHYQKEDFPPLC